MQVNDGSCLSNMQCVVSSDAEGYDQVLSLLFNDNVYTPCISCLLQVDRRDNLSKRRKYICHLDMNCPSSSHYI